MLRNKGGGYLLENFLQNLKNHEKNFACGGLKTSFLKVLEHSNSWKYLVLLPKMINSDAKNHRNYLQNGKFSRCARHPTHGSGSLAGRMEAHWFCRWCFHEREKALLLITKSFLFYWGALILLLMFSRAGEGASTNYKIVFVLLRRTGFAINVFADGRRRFYHSQNNI